jgi:hypothetical protein
MGITKLGKCNVIWYFVVMIVVMCISLYSHACVFSFFIPSDLLDLYDNSLMGTIPSQIALMSNLGESSVVWLLVVRLCCHVFFIVLSCLLVIFHSTDYLDLYDNNFMGEFTCPGFIDDCWISCDFLTDTYTQACRSL